MPDDANPRAIIGANNPPADPFTAHDAHISDLYVEAGNWLDGAEIENAAQAEVVERLINEFKDAIDAAKASEVDQTKPLLDEVETVRARYRPLIGETKQVTGKAVRAKTMLLGLKTRWGNKLEAERKAEAERLRKEAAEQARVAAEAAREAVGDLQATEEAEDLIRAAQTTLRAATQAEKPAVRGMRDNWIVKGFAPWTDDAGKVLDGRVALLRFYFKTNPEALVAACMELARTDVRLGRRSIPGLIIENDRRAV